MDTRVACCKKREQRFWLGVEIRSKDQCWNWKLSMRGGYGQFRISSKKGEVQKLGSHQVSFACANGFLPEAVRHTCDNQKCCNPKHLIAGTQTQNVQDTVDHGRTARGTANHRVKLSDEHVRAIRNDKWSSQNTKYSASS